MPAGDDFRPGRCLVHGLPPENAVAAAAAAGDITAAGVCRMLGFYEDVLDSRGWDAAPTLWLIERLTTAPGRAGLAGCGGWQLPMPESGDDLAATVRGFAGFVDGPAFEAIANPRHLAAWVLGTEAWSVPVPDPDEWAALPGWLRQRTEMRVLYAADRAGLRYQLLRPRGGTPVMYVAEGAEGSLAGPVQDAVAELALAGGPAPGDVA
jgi:hypothetical protein